VEEGRMQTVDVRTEQIALRNYLAGLLPRLNLRDTIIQELNGEVKNRDEIISARDEGIDWLKNELFIAQRPQDPQS
jgi:uncharacterized protein (DUF3084 family)